jgi:hypothetical protein
MLPDECLRSQLAYDAAQRMWFCQAPLKKMSRATN